MGFLRSLAFLVVVATWLCGCTADELTQIIVVVDSDLETPSELSRVTIEVEGLGNQPAVTTDLNEQPLPIWLGLVNEGDTLGPIRVRVTGFDGLVSRVAAERTNVSFQRGKTLMLRIELLRACVSDESACAQACDGDDTCLTPWTGPPSKLDASAYDAGDDAGSDDAGSEDAAVDASDAMVDASDAMVDASDDAMTDAGPIDPCSVEGATCFDYTPSNFDPSVLGAELSNNGALTIDCTDAVFDSTTLTLSGACAVPLQVVEIVQVGDVPAVVIPVTSLTIEGGSALRLVGDRPVIFAVFGAATISGELDASAVLDAPGAGGDVACAVGTGRPGPNQTMTNRGANGGGGGAFGSVGGTGGRGDLSQVGSTQAVTPAGMVEGNAQIVPLRGGCAGGRGGQHAASNNVGGAGGGAVQVSTAGALALGGAIASGGGGGEKALALEDGGGGGGSGGAILLEGDIVSVTGAAWITANGGGGGGGWDYDAVDANPQPGANAALRSSAGGLGGAGDNRGGDGGNGAGASTAAVAGGNAAGGTPVFDPNFGAGGGGGGGGLGRIRIRDNTRASSLCVLPGNFSPAAVIECGG